MRRLLVSALLAACAAPAAAQRPVVTLNHVVVVIDSASYLALGASPFMRDSLGRLEQRTTTADGGASWSGTYLYGRHTYLEMFAPYGPAGDESGSMIGYGVDQPGALWAVQKRLVSAGLQVDSILRSRARGSEQVPWFHAIAVKGAMTTSRMPTWVMEYHADYQRRWSPESPKAWQGIRRDQVLADRYDKTRPLVDVIGIDVAVDSADRVRVMKEAESYGFVAKGGGEYRGPDFRLRVLTPEKRRGVVAVEMRLTGRTLAPGLRRIGPRTDIEVTSRGTAILTVR